MPININALKKHRQFDFSGYIKQLYQDIQQLRNLQAYAWHKAKYWGDYSGKAALMLILSIVTAVIFLFFPLYLPILVVSIPVIIISIYFTFKFHFRCSYYKQLSFDKVDFRVPMADVLINLLNKDAYRHRPWQIELDLKDRERTTNKHSESPHPLHMNRTVHRYRDEFLQCKGGFVDGTKLRMTLTERYQACLWRNENGKSRRREKHKGFSMQLRLKPDGMFYPNLEEFGKTAKQLIQLPPTVELEELTIKNQRIDLRIKIPQQVAHWRVDAQAQTLLYNSVVMSLLSVYQMLNLIRMANGR